MSVAHGPNLSAHTPATSPLDHPYRRAARQGRSLSLSHSTKTQTCQRIRIDTIQGQTLDTTKPVIAPAPGRRTEIRWRTRNMITDTMLAPHTIETEMSDAEHKMKFQWCQGGAVFRPRCLLLYRFLAIFGCDYLCILRFTFDWAHAHSYSQYTSTDFRGTWRNDLYIASHLRAC